MSPLQRLRALMAKQKIQLLNFQKEAIELSSIGIHAFLIETNDAHQSEYVGPEEKRREWATGFTGSAGTAVVTQQKALMWTDGRYFVQAEQQLSKEWTLMKQDQPNVPSLYEWLIKNMKKGEKVGIDSHLMSVSNAKKLYDELIQHEIFLVAIDGPNLIDLIWNDKPLLTGKGNIFLLENQFTGENAVQKVERLRKELQAKQVDAMILTALDDIAWLFNLRTTADIPFNPVCYAYALITMDSCFLFADSDRFDQTLKDSLTPWVTFFPYKEAIPKIQSFAANHLVSKVLLDPNQCNVALAEAFTGCVIKNDKSPVMTNKVIKNAVEIEGMKNAHIRDGVALVSFFAWLNQQIQNGVSINEVEAAYKEEEIRSKMKYYVSLSFDTISSIGSNGAIIHYKPEKETCATLNANELYLNDSGGQYLDGTTDVTRTLHFGTPTDEEKFAFTSVLNAHIAFARATFPDEIEGVKLDTIARSMMWKEGLDYGHGTGHGIGAFLNVHEVGVSIPFRMNPNALKIQENMIVTNEPGYYVNGKYGIRIESVLVVKEKKIPNRCGKKFCCFETITMVPIQRSLVALEMMTEDAIQWLDAYHQTVYETLQPLLKDNTVAMDYLYRQTRPLRESNE